MQGGYNIHPLIDALDDAKLAPIAAKALSHTLLMFDNFYDVEEKAKAGNEHAKQVMQSGLTPVVPEPSAAGRENHCYRLQGHRRNEHR